LSNGAEASIFEVIEGSLPTDTLHFDLVEKIGIAAGELNLKISNLEITHNEISKCNTLPYYDLWKVHSKIYDPKNFYNTVNSNLFDDNEDFPSLRKDTNYLINEIQTLMERVQNYLERKEDFPHQLIHGDLHHENILCVIDDSNKGKVTAILDFEFIAWDLRAMELAICLSKFASEPDPLNCFEAFIKGYAKNALLNPKELNVMVDLILLRIISNFVYFVGRFLGKEEPLNLCLNKVGVYARRVKWLKENSDKINQILLTYFN